MELDFHLFKQEDYPAYYSWFQDPDLHKQLGPMQEEEDEWLTYVLNEQAGLTEFGGSTYSVFSNQELVAVMGIANPSAENPTYGITSIAVNPLLRSRGIGSRILKRIMEIIPLENGQYWIARVAEHNPKAKSFFEKNGWRCVSIPAENNDMFLFEYRNH